MHQNHENLHHVARDNLRDFIHKPSHNTNGDSIVLNIPEGFAEKAADTNDSGVATAVAVVYVTVAPSFSGSVLGYVTASTGTNTAAQATAAISAASAVVSDTDSNAVTSSTVQYTPMVGTPIATSRSTASSAATTANAATTATTAASATTATNLQNSLQNTAAASAQSTTSSNTGLTAGAQAGLAIGIIGGIALIAGLFFFCFKRKRNNAHEELNEKSAYKQNRSSFFGTAAGKRASADSDRSFGTIHNTATAPRLSLRPVTQFLPVFGEKRKSANLLGSNGAQMSEKPSAYAQGENPFADSAAQNDRQANPFDEGDGRSIRSNGSDGASVPQTPVSATAAAIPVGHAAPGARGPNNVHRVQLDFKPSMDDELELKSGQLVRMLHEYDDGWALCVRMDRSQQGVAPRTCLSKQPVKPRGPPPGGRISPQGNNMRGPPQGPGVARKPVPGQAI